LFPISDTVTIPRVDGLAGYRVRYRKQGTTAWTELDVAQPSSGNAVVVTPAVEAGQTYEFQVCSYNKVSQTSDWVPTTPVTKTAGADTTAPAAPTGLTATAGVRKIILTWNANTEVDLKEYLVYRNTTNDPSTATLIARVRTTRLEVDSPIGVTYYFWVRAVDFSGNVSGWSSAASAAAVAENINNVTDTAPATPTISVTSEEVDTATVFRTWITVTITRVDGAGGYVVAYRKQGETNWNKIYVEQPSSGNPVVRTPDLPASTTYEVMACSVSPKGVASSWTSITTVTTQANNTPPNAPSSISCTPGINTLFLSCSSVSATDFAYYEWYADTSSPPSTVIGTSSVPYFVWKPPSYSAYYVGVKAVDTAGNKSSLTSSSLTYTPAQVGQTDIAPNAVTAEKILDGAVTDIKLASGAVTLTKFASGLRPVQVVSSLPTLPDPNYPQGATVFLTTDNKLYRSTGSSWTAAVPTSDLLGQITETQIADNAISTPKLQANAVTAAKIAAEAVTSDKIAANAVTAGKIAAGAVSTDQLAANAVTAAKIAAGAVSASKLAVAQIFIEGLTWTDNSPSTGYVSWSACTVYYQGTAYSISAGSTNQKYIYWNVGSTTFTASNTKPDWAETRFMIAINDNGYHKTVWNATLIHGGTLITGTITAQEIAANAITADKISAGAVTTDKLAANAVTADKIAASAVTAEKIAAGAVTTDKISAKAITTEKLTFVASINLVPDGDFEAGNAAEWTAGTAVTSPVHGGSYSLSLAGGSSAYSKAYIPVEPNAKYYVSGWIYSATAGYVGEMYVFWYNLNKSYVGFTFVGLASSASWTQVSTTATAPSNAYYARIYLASSTVTHYYDDIVMKKIQGTVDIDDGAITAPKIKVGEVKTSHIRFDTLTSDPTYEAGMMWYRADLDELRFASGTTYDKVMQIPKIPLGAPMRALFWYRSTWLPEGCEWVTVGGSGFPDWTSGGVALATGGLSGSYARLEKQWHGGFTSWNKKRIVSVLLGIPTVARARLRIWSGSAYLMSGYPFFGVYFDNNSDSNSATLYGISWNGVALSAVTLGTVSAGQNYLITIEFTPGTSIKFYINGSLAGIITTNLPSGTTNSEHALRIEIYNYVAFNKFVAVYQVACIQEL
jgi:hypothetical protein